MAFFDSWNGHKKKKLQDLMIDKMSEALEVEEKLSAILPKMAHAATSPFLRFDLEEQAKQTENQAGRLKQAFDLIGQSPQDCYSFVAHGLVEESEKAIAIENLAVRDAALVSEIKNLKENEIATYETIYDWAKEIGQKEIAEIFSQTLSEEEGALGKLDDLSKRLYKNASR